MVRAVTSLHHAGNDVGTGGVDEQLEFVEARVDRFVGLARIGDGDQHDLLPDRPVDQGAGERFVVGRVAHELPLPISTWISAMNVAGPVRIARSGASSEKLTEAVPPSMCTTTSSTLRATSPQDRAA